ncbi:MAG: tetratricopeptide repeat protein [Cyanobacteria bacterium J06638_22]
MSNDAQFWINRGRQQFGASQFAEALHSFEQAIAADPNRAEAWNGKGVALRNLNRLEEAQAALDRALKLYPQLPRAWFNKGLLLEESLNRPTEAAECYRRALQLQPDLTEAQRRYQQLTQKSAQAASFNALFPSTPKPTSQTSADAEQWFQRGVQQYKAGDLVEAIASWEQAIALKPDLHEAWNNRGVALSALGQQEAAIESYDKVLEFKPDDHEVWFNRGGALSALGQKEAAIAAYDKALECKPDYHEAWFNRGGALSALGQKEAAIAAYDKALECKPDYHEAWGNRGIALYDLGRHEEAAASYDQVLNLKPDEDAAWNNRGNALSALGQKEAAIAAYDKALECKPDLHEAWKNRGNALYDLGRHEAAIAAYDKALELKPDYDAAWIDRGNALSALGHREEAIESFDRAIALKFDVWQAWSGRGNALSALGHREEAIESFDRAIALKFDVWQAWSGRGNAASNSRQCKTSMRWTLPAALQNSALDQRGYPGALACYAEGLRHVEREPQPEGWGRLHQSTGWAHYVFHRFAPHQRGMMQEAVREYHLALEVLTPDAFPEAHLETLQDLIRAELGLGNTDTARHCQIQGVAVLQALLNQSPTVKKRQLEFKFHSFRQITVDLLVQEEQFVQALREAERDKNRCLNWMLSAWQEPQWSPDLEQMQEFLDASTAAVYWHLSPDVLTTFVLRTDAPELWVLPDGEINSEQLPASRQQKQAFETWVKEWNQDYEDYRLKGKEVSADERKQHPWRKQLSERLARLRDILRIPELEEQLTGMSRLILVPHQDLHRFPLHMLFDQHFTVSYLPSLQIGISQKARSTFTPITPQSTLLSLEAPDHEGLGELKHSKIESSLIAQLFQQPTRLSPEQAKLDAVQQALAQPHNLLHFTGHGAYNTRQPNRSVLSLTGTDELTAETIQALDLSSYALVCLASCETAATGLQMLEVDYVGLASALLRAGVAQVVSSLWLADEVSSTYLMLYFYEQLLSPEQPTPAEALWMAQDWLQRVTYPDLVQWLQRMAERLGDEELEFQAEAILRKPDKMNATAPPYADPYYWATFIFTGNPTP